MERYIEVIGEGQFSETASCFVANVVLEVRAAKNDTAFAEVGELCREAVKLLRDSGITDSEIVEGGSDLHVPWYWKKEAGQTAQRTIILKVADFGRLNNAIEMLEPLQSRNKERKTIRIDMRQPVFESDSKTKAAALGVAFRDARDKAEELAIKSGGKLGRVIHIEESGWAKRNSGFGGDTDWDGDQSRFGFGGGTVVLAASSGVGTDTEEKFDPQKPTRDIFMKCRVRFELLDS